jgi:hypothetical protein
VNSFFSATDGGKLLESQVFHLSSCTSKRDAQSQLRHAWDRSSSDAAPWAHIPMPSQIFGKAGCLRSRDASASIDQQENYITR